MEGYVPPPDLEVKGRGGKAKKVKFKALGHEWTFMNLFWPLQDPNMPKKGLSAYFIFSNEKRAQIRQADNLSFPRV